jgi:hypothetical protein
MVLDFFRETGKTFEDFITKFFTYLETITNEISNDRYDNNVLWLLGQYVNSEGKLLNPIY